jgi:hypothetical protein
MAEDTDKKEVKKYRKYILTLAQYGVITLLLIGSFYIGKFRESYKNETKEEPTIPIVNTVRKDNINLAVDEGNNLIIIDNTTGRYTIYQDSIGYKIFKLYAGTIWRESGD